MTQLTSTITLYRKPKDGEQGPVGPQGPQGDAGQDAITLQLSTPVIAFPTMDGKIATGASYREVNVTAYKGSTPITISNITTNWSAAMPFTVDLFLGVRVLRLNVTPGATWTSDSMLTITATINDGGTSLIRTISLNVIGSAQGQTVTGPQGASISKVEEYYLATATATVPDASASGWQKDAHIEPTAALPYVWNKEVVYVTDPVTKQESPINTDVHLCCTFSDGLTKHESTYQVTPVPSASPEDWTDLATAMSFFNATNRYFWNKEVVEYKDTTKNRTDIRLVAVWGEQGSQGEQGPQGDKGDQGEQGPQGEHGADGKDGTNGKDGKDGTTYYTWIKYSDIANPTESTQIYDKPTATTEYIGIAINQTVQSESTDPSVYTWSKFKGDQGVPGDKGDQGEKGDKGDKGDPGTNIDIKGEGLKYYAIWGDYFADDTKVTGNYLVFGRQDPASLRPQSIAGAYIYTYDADTDETVITLATTGHAYICVEDRHLYVASDPQAYASATVTDDSSSGIKQQVGLLNPTSYWQDCGELRGADAISIITEGESVIFPDAGTAQRVYIDVYRGKTKLAYMTDYTCSVLSATDTVLDGKVSWRFTTSGGRFSYALVVKSDYKGTDITGTIPFTVTVNGVEYKRNINVRTVLNGQNGYNGCLVRRSEWQPNTLYRNDSSHTSVDPLTGQYIIDEVSITDLATGTAQWFLATAAHNGILSSDSNRPLTGGNTYWTPINDLRPLRTSFADIMTAFIQYLQVNQIVIEDPTTHLPYGAFGAAVNGNSFPLWFGGQNPDQAIVKFDKNGNVWFGPNFNVINGDIAANGVTFNGIFANGGEFGGFVKRGYVVITNDNYLDYGYFYNKKYHIDIERAGSLIILHRNFSMFTSDGIELTLGGADSNWPQVLKDYELRKLRQLTASRVVIYNYSMARINIAPYAFAKDYIGYIGATYVPSGYLLEMECSYVTEQAFDASGNLTWTGTLQWLVSRLLMAPNSPQFYFDDNSHWQLNLLRACIAETSDEGTPLSYMPANYRNDMQREWNRIVREYTTLSAKTPTDDDERQKMQAYTDAYNNLSHYFTEVLFEVVTNTSNPPTCTFFDPNYMAYSLVVLPNQGYTGNQVVQALSDYYTQADIIKTL